MSDSEARTAQLCTPFRPRSILLLAALTIVWGGVLSAEGGREPVELMVDISKEVLRPGQTAELTVRLRYADGTVREVTDSGELLFESARKFSESPPLAIDSRGRVRALGFDLSKATTETVAVVHSSYGLSAYVSLTIVPEGSLWLTADKTVLGVGESTRLRVLEVAPEGEPREIQGQDSVEFSTSQDHMLIPEPGGRATCIGTRGEPREQALITAKAGERRGLLELELLASGPGPGLIVTTASPQIRVGRVVQVKVLRPTDQGLVDVTSTATGTRYLVFDGTGRPSDEFLRVDESGQAVATTTLGPFARVNVVVFVRNGEDVGWTEILVVPK